MAHYEINKDAVIPYFVHESMITRMELVNKRLWILCIILIVLLMGTNAGWMYYESQWEDVIVVQEAEADGDSDINLQSIGGDYYGGQSETDY